MSAPAAGRAPARIARAGRLARATLLARAGLLALAACGSKAAPPPPCEDLRGFVARTYARMHREAGAETPAQARRAADIKRQIDGPMKDAIVGACRADGWSREVIACLVAADTTGKLDDCESRLAPAQRAHVDQAMTQVLAAIAPADDGAAEDGDDGPDDAAAAGDRDGGAPARGATGPVGAALDAGAAPPACADLAAAVDALLAEQRRDLPPETAARAAATAAALAAPMKDALVAACARDAWPADVIACHGAARTTAALAACEARLTPAQQQGLARAMDDATARIAGGGTQAAGAPAGSGAAPAEVRVADCDAYLARVNTMLTCDRVPADERARMQRAAAVIVEGLRRLGDPRLPSGARADAGAGCRAALAALADRARALGCP